MEARPLAPDGTPASLTYITVRIEQLMPQQRGIGSCERPTRAPSAAWNLKNEALPLRGTRSGLDPHINTTWLPWAPVPKAILKRQRLSQVVVGAQPPPCAIDQLYQVASGCELRWKSHLIGHRLH